MTTNSEKEQYLYVLYKLLSGSGKATWGQVLRAVPKDWSNEDIWTAYYCSKKGFCIYGLYDQQDALVSKFERDTRWIRDQLSFSF